MKSSDGSTNLSKISQLMILPEELLQTYRVLERICNRFYRDFQSQLSKN